jgi:3-hydroxyacyl-[acyl-carrier-protein] dehydratase
MPGVLMLQTLVEAGAWLLRISEDFRHSVIVLRDAKNVKYGTFMEPGRQMQLSVELLEQGPELASFKGRGEVDGQATVSARLTLGRYNLRDRRPGLEATDAQIVQHLKRMYTVLRGDLDGI